MPDECTKALESIRRQEQLHDDEVLGEPWHLRGVFASLAQQEVVADHGLTLEPAKAGEGWLLGTVATRLSPHDRQLISIWRLLYDLAAAHLNVAK